MEFVELRRRLSHMINILLLCWMTSCVSADSSSKLVLLPVGPTEVHLGETLSLQSTDPEVLWNVIGEPQTGTIDAFGLYQAPDLMPEDPQVTILGRRGEEKSYALIMLIE